MHPPDRGFGKPPRNQQLDRTVDGGRPLLQGYLKRKNGSAESTPARRVAEGSTAPDPEASNPAPAVSPTPEEPEAGSS